MKILISFLLEKLSTIVFLSCSSLAVIAGVALPNLDLNKNMDKTELKQEEQLLEERKEEVASKEEVQPKQLEVQNIEESKQEVVKEEVIVPSVPSKLPVEETKPSEKVEEEPTTSFEQEKVKPDVETNDNKEEEVEKTENLTPEVEKPNAQEEKEVEKVVVPEQEQPSVEEMPEPEHKFKEPEVKPGEKFEEPEVNEPEVVLPSEDEETKEEVKQEIKEEEPQEKTEPQLDKETEKDTEESKPEVEVPVQPEEKEEVEEPKQEEVKTPEIDEPSIEEEQKSSEVEKSEDVLPEQNQPSVEEIPELSPKFEEPEVKPGEKFEEPEVNEPEVVEPEKDEVKPEEVIPEVKEGESQEEPTVDREPEINNEEVEQDEQITPEVVKPNVQEEKDSQKVDEPTAEVQQSELIAKIREAVAKTTVVDSVYFTRTRTGVYPGTEKIKYSKSQNRQWFYSENNGGYVEEYLEGKAGNYPPTSNGRVSSYYAQTWWSRTNENPEWVKKSPLISYFGISEFGWLKEIKSVELRGTRPFDYYIITLDKAFANEAAKDLLNAGYYLKDGMFNTDVTVGIQINHEGYVVSFSADWGKEVLNEPSYGPIKISLGIGYFNSTVINRPKDLNDEPEERQKPSDELTATQKLEIKNKIFNAFTQTRNVNSATYESNGTTVKYNRDKNVALMENSKETTYYEGTEGNYVDHNFVGPDYHHKNWTKASGSQEWIQNTTKHKTFTPQELYFLDRSYIVISDVTKVETNDNLNTYTITILKYGANLAYSHVYGISDKFANDITMTVSLDNEGYIREMKTDFGLDLKIYDFNKTEVGRPVGIPE